MASRTRSKGSIDVEVGLFGPRALLEPPPQVRDDPLKLLRGAAATEQQHFALLARQLPERLREIDPEITTERLERFTDQLAVAAGPGCEGTVSERFRFVGNYAGRVKVHHRAKTLAVRARAV